MKHEWSRIAVDGRELDVSRDALSVDGVRINVTYAQALEWARKLGARLPTPCELDARHAAARVKLLPMPGPIAYRTGLQHSLDVDTQARQRGLTSEDIVSCAGKHWVRRQDGSEPPPDEAPLFAWHVDAEHVTWNAENQRHEWRGIPVYPSSISGVFVIQRYAPKAHNRHHGDYSMTLVLARDVGEEHDTDPSPPSHPPPTKRGDRGAAVLAWQRYLADGGYEPGPVDGIHGPRTERATIRWREEQLPDTERELPPAAPLEVKFRQAKHFYARRAEGPPIWVVIHTAETIEHSESAEALQSYAATMADGRQVSWHYSIDSDTICQSVLEEHTAFAAPGANARGIQIELAGYARQTEAEWADPYSTAQLELLARLVARCCQRWGIPAKRVGPDRMLRGEAGICGHIDVTLGVGKGRTNHTDPGANFPWLRFLELVRAAMGRQ